MTAFILNVLLRLEYSKYIFEEILMCVNYIIYKK